MDTPESYVSAESSYEPERFSYRSAVRTDIGLRRKENQDAYGYIKTAGGSLYVVADGMGGARGGATAAALAVNVIVDGAIDDNGELTLSSIRRAISLSNQVIFARSQRDSDLSGMGTTVVVLALVGSQAYLAHVGDSRIYHWRNGKLVQLTRDHTLVQELVDTGAIPEEEAANHPIAHMLTRSLGPLEAVDISISALSDPVRPGDKFIMCTDGLYNHVTNNEICDIVSGRCELDEAAERLKQLAIDDGGTDNVTLQIIEIHHGDGVDGFSADPENVERVVSAQAESRRSQAAKREPKKVSPEPNGKGPYEREADPAITTAPEEPFVLDSFLSGNPDVDGVDSIVPPNASTDDFFYSDEPVGQPSELIDDSVSSFLTNDLIRVQLGAFMVVVLTLGAVIYSFVHSQKNLQLANAKKPTTARLVTPGSAIPTNATPDRTAAVNQPSENAISTGASVSSGSVSSGSGSSDLPQGAVASDADSLNSSNAPSDIASAGAGSTALDAARPVSSLPESNGLSANSNVQVPTFDARASAVTSAVTSAGTTAVPPSPNLVPKPDIGGQDQLALSDRQFEAKRGAQPDIADLGPQADVSAETAKKILERDDHVSEAASSILPASKTSGSSPANPLAVVSEINSTPLDPKIAAEILTAKSSDSSEVPTLLALASDLSIPPPPKLRLTGETSKVANATQPIIWEHESRLVAKVATQAEQTAEELRTEQNSAATSSAPTIRTEEETLEIADAKDTVRGRIADIDAKLEMLSVDKREDADQKRVAIEAEVKRVTEAIAAVQQSTTKFEAALTGWRALQEKASHVDGVTLAGEMAQLSDDVKRKTQLFQQTNEKYSAAVEHWQTNPNDQQSAGAMSAAARELKSRRTELESAVAQTIADGINNSAVTVEKNKVDGESLERLRKRLNRHIGFYRAFIPTVVARRRDLQKTYLLERDQLVKQLKDLQTKLSDELELKVRNAPVKVPSEIE